jgi:ankyrin repeat protein
MSHGANIHALDSQNRTPLHYACEYSKMDNAKFLATYEGCDVNYKSLSGFTPLRNGINILYYQLEIIIVILLYIIFN